MTIRRFKRVSLLAVLFTVAGPAAAETVTLSCKWEQSPGVVAGAKTLRIDYATGLVEEVGGERAKGEVSANAIVWSGTRSFVATAVDNVPKSELTAVFKGRID